MVGDQYAGASVECAQVFEAAQMDLSAAVFDQFEVAVGLEGLCLAVEFAFFAEFAARAEDGKVDVVEIQAAENTVPDRYGMIFRSVVTVDISKHITLDHKRSLFTDNIRFL